MEAGADEVDMPNMAFRQIDARKQDGLISIRFFRG